ncbi:hypothetical protein N752_28940 [Desulforamulus aquiferis]|nr:hypothetical protein [Desulforamulus aquiferis]RYD01605.1 hypothetical protein N752_28940 [Desulforamulus aquiferis]
MEEKEAFESIQLIIPESVSQLMEDRLILTEDIQKVIHFAENTGTKMQIKENGHYLAYHRPISVTYWVEYLPQPEGYMIFNTYSHRMEINEDVNS